MSVTLEVYPTIERIPSYAELLALANVHIKTFLREVGLTDTSDLAVALRGHADETIPSDPSDVAWWAHRSIKTAWFHFAGRDGGIDAYARAYHEVWPRFLPASGKNRRPAA